MKSSARPPGRRPPREQSAAGVARLRRLDEQDELRAPRPASRRSGAGRRVSPRLGSSTSRETPIARMPPPGAGGDARPLRSCEVSPAPPGLRIQAAGETSIAKIEAALVRGDVERLQRRRRVSLRCRRRACLSRLRVRQRRPPNRPSRRRFESRTEGRTRSARNSPRGRAGCARWDRDRPALRSFEPASSP